MKRSVGASILAVIAVFAGIVAIIDVLRYLGFLFSPLSFFSPGFGFIGAIMAGIVAAIWFWAAQKLWAQDEQGWLFMVVMAIVYLIFDFVALLGGNSFSSMLTSVVISALILVIAFLPGTKEGFGRS
jgi:hypothetical protein